MEKTRSETKDREFGQKENNRNLTPTGNVFLVNSAVYWGAPRLADTGECHNLSFALVRKDPVDPAFILVYLDVTFSG